jgi:probable FeS assembly SUF system protein SufT
LNQRSHENEPIVVQRDVKAVAIPAGIEVKLKLGQVGYITQALGGSFTVYVDGNLFRIAGSEADAIGMTVATAPEVPPEASEEDIKNVVWQQLKTCYDPEIPVNIVDLGLIYECDVRKNEDATRTVDIKMTLTAPGCGMGEVLVQDVRDKVEIVPTVAQANVELVFDPPWNHTMMSDEARLQTGMM